MNLKKFAVRGIVALAIFVALCMFFSGTIRTITTPKVKLVQGKRGKLEERMDLSGKLAFPDVEKLAVELPEGVSVTITAVNTRVGYSVKAGDVLVEGKVAGYDAARKQYQDAYDQAAEQLMSLENKNRNVRVSKRDEAYAEAYFALRDARRDATAARLDMQALLSKEEKTLTESGYPEEASEALVAAIDAWRAATDAQNAAQQAMDAVSRYSVEETVWSYLTERRGLEEKQADAEAGLQKLLAVSEQVRRIAAPHDGYIAEVNVKAEDTYTGGQPMIVMTAEDAMPVLRADVSNVNRGVAEGTTVSYTVDSYESIDTNVVTSGTDAEGKKYVDVALNDRLIRERGSIYAMTLEDTPLQLVYRAREATTLLPVSAVRGAGDDRYVYVVEENTAAFGASTMKLRKLGVTVLAEYGGTASVQEDIGYYTIAYMEDRPVNEGDTVMEYLS